MLAACSFAGDTLEAERQASILGVLGQFWTFLQAKQVRGFAVLMVKASCLWEAGAAVSSCFILLGLGHFCKAEYNCVAHVLSAGLLDRLVLWEMDFEFS